jgi:hypothetical protein
MAPHLIAPRSPLLFPHQVLYFHKTFGCSTQTAKWYRMAFETKDGFAQ